METFPKFRGENTNIFEVSPPRQKNTLETMVENISGSLPNHLVRNMAIQAFHRTGCLIGILISWLFEIIPI